MLEQGVWSRERRPRAAVRRRPGRRVPGTRRPAGHLTALLTCAVLAACAGGEPSSEAERSAADPTAAVSTLSPLPMPSIGPPPGKVVADLRQSSRDAALGRFAVWIGNGLPRDITPKAITYVDPRFRHPIAGERLRANPSGSERGYPLPLPSLPACAADPSSATGRVTVALGDDRTVVVPVEDEADVVERYVSSRCFELATRQVATLSFSDEVIVEGAGKGAVGTLTLVARPSGVADGTLLIEAVAGTPVLTAETPAAWQPRAAVTGDGAPVRIRLPVVPARCDAHAFAESGGATAFAVRLRHEGREGQLVVRMSPTGAARAIEFALESCGL